MTSTATEPLELLAVQYADASDTITTEEDDAHTATYFTPGAAVFLALKRSPRGKWMWDFSDFIPGTGPLWRARWATAAEALDAAVQRLGRPVREVEL